MSRFTTAILLIVAALALLTFMQHAEASPTCDRCVASGNPYLCKVSMQSGLCFQNAGDASCDGSGCTCCRKEAVEGCRSCEDDIVEDDDDMDSD